MTEDNWDGTERRVSDQMSIADKRLAVAITEVRDLRNAAAKLAEAVQVRASQFQRLFLQVAGLTAILFVAIVIFSMWQVGRLTDKLDHGHDLITCLLLVDPSTRTAQTLIDCQRTFQP